MKKIILVVAVLLGLGVSAFANPVYNLRIENCGTSQATVQFKTSNTGQFYVISSSDHNANGWVWSVTFIDTVINNANTDSNSSVVVVDNDTKTVVTGYFES